MKLSNCFYITRREYPKDEKSSSTKLLIKSGMILKNEDGIYTYLPFGFKVLENIKKIITEEMTKSNAKEVLMPSLISSNVYEQSNRIELFDKELFNITDRNNKSYSLCPTHEELFANLAKHKIQSYKDLHFTLFQISNKYRDEYRCSNGIIRKKEFCMADAYSFDANDGGLDISYDKMFQTFKHIFDRLSLNTIVVSSDASTMKGLSSEEFQVLSEYGDRETIKCTNCTYTCSLEDAIPKNEYKNIEEKERNIKLVNTNGAISIKELTKRLDVKPDRIINSIIIKVNDTYKMLLLRGYAKPNISKIKKIFNTNNIEVPFQYELEKIGTFPGFIGPINSTMEIIADKEVKNMVNAVCGSNKKNHHYINVNPGADFKVSKYCDIKLFDHTTDHCPKCKNNCKLLRGIEVGHIFKLGDTYSENYNLKYTDEINEINYVHMGSYGIGLDRCMASIVESNNDDKGIIWPYSVAPFKVAIVIANINDKDTYKYANYLHDKLESLGIETLLDDRKETIGVKFSDIDLIGIPLRITIGSKYKDDIVELKERTEELSIDIKTNKIVDEVTKIIKSHLC